MFPAHDQVSVCTLMGSPPVSDVACSTSDSSPDIMKVHLHHLDPTQTHIITLASFFVSAFNTRRVSGFSKTPF